MLYIEIHEQKLLLAHINKNKICAYKIAELADQTINQGVIFNSKNILIHIKEFIHTHKLKKPWAVINAPELHNKEGIFQTLAVFQFALILGKADIKIQKMISIPQTTDDLAKQPYINNIPLIINNTQTPNLLQQIQAKTPTNPIIWLGTTISCFVCAMFIITSISQTQLQKLLKLQQSQNHLQESISEMQPKNNDLIDLRKQNEALNSTINKSHKYLSKNKNPLELLDIVASKIPNNVWLSKIELGDASKIKNPQELSQKATNASPKSYKIEFVGYSHQIDSPLKFIEKLSTNTNNINGLKLTYLKKLRTNTNNKKQQPTTSEKKYEFKIIGRLV